MANPFVGYLANVAGRTVAGVGSAIYGALTDSKESILFIEKNFP